MTAPTQAPVPPLAARIRGLAAFGLAVGLARYVAEFVAPQAAMYFGVYYLMPVALAWVGLRRACGRPAWRTVAGSMLVMAVIAWGIPNTLAYTTGQFLEWNHGRFYNGGPEDPANRAAPIAATAFGKVGQGLLQGALTSLAGGVWCTAWATVLVWLPARAGRSPVR